MTLPRMLVVDLDGTALTGRNTLRQDDIEAALELQRRGIHLTIATGRLLAGTRASAEQLEINGSLAVMNGSSRYDVAREKLHYADVFSAPQKAEINAILRSHDLPGFLFGLDQIHVHREHLRYADYLRIWTPSLVEHDGEAWNQPTQTLAIGAVGEHATVEAAGALLLEEMPDLRMKFFNTFDGERFIELRHSEQDKGTALIAMAKERGVPVEEVVAVGDWWNDVPMMRVAGLSFAMGGATPEVLQVADHELDAQAREGGAIAEIARRVWDVR